MSDPAASKFWAGHIMRELERPKYRKKEEPPHVADLVVLEAQLRMQNFHYVNRRNWEKFAASRGQDEELINENRQKVVDAIEAYLETSPVLFSSDLEQAFNQVIYVQENMRKVEELAMPYEHFRCWNCPDSPTTFESLPMTLLYPDGNRFLRESARVGYVSLARAIEETVESMGGIATVMKKFSLDRDHALRNATMLKNPYTLNFEPPFPRLWSLDFGALNWKEFYETEGSGEIVLAKKFRPELIYHLHKQDMLNWFAEQLEQRTARERQARNKLFGDMYKPIE